MPPLPVAGADETPRSFQAASDLAAIFDALPSLSLSDTTLPSGPAVYLLYRGAAPNRPIYAGYTYIIGLKRACERHISILTGRVGISAAEITCRYIVSEDRQWLRTTKRLLVYQYAPEWNVLKGFGSAKLDQQCTCVGKWEIRFPRVDSGPIDAVCARHTGRSLVLNSHAAIDAPLLYPKKNVFNQAESQCDGACLSLSYDTNKTSFVELFLAAMNEVLPLRSQLILEMRFGLHGDRVQSLQQVGNCFGISRERIRQIVTKSLKRLSSAGARRSRQRSPAPNPVTACGKLLEYLLLALEPGQDGFAHRLLDFIDANVTFLPRGPVAISLILGILGTRRFTDLQPVLAAAAAARTAGEKEQRDASAHDAQPKNSGRFLFSDIVWPPTVHAVDVRRLVSEMPRDEPSGMKSPHILHSTKLGREVHCSSPASLRFFRLLEHSGAVATYLERPFSVSYTLDGIEQAFYPDALLVLADGRGVVADVQSMSHMALHANLRRWSGLRAFAAERGLGVLVTDGEDSIQSLVRREVPEEFEQTLLTALEDGPLLAQDYANLASGFRLPQFSLQSVVLRHRLVMRLGPFRIARPGGNVTL